MSGWDLAGAGSLQAIVSYSPNRIDVTQAKVLLDRLHVWGHGLYVDEPRIEVTGAAKWDSASGQFNSPGATLAAGQLQLRLTDANWEIKQVGSGSAGSGLVARGVASYQADLSQLRRWFQNPRARPTWNVAGRLSGQAEVPPPAA